MAKFFKFVFGSIAVLVVGFIALGAYQARFGPPAPPALAMTLFRTGTGLQVTSQEPGIIAECRVTLNSEWIANNLIFEGGNMRTLPYGMFARGDGSRFSIVTHRVLRADIDCGLRGSRPRHGSWTFS